MRDIEGRIEDELRRLEKMEKHNEGIRKNSDGIADEIRRKATISDSYVGEIAARGEVELAVQQISELVPVAGIDIVGPLPGELQKISVFSGGVFRAAKNADGAGKLIAYLASPRLRPVLTRKGLEPVSPASNL